MALASHDPHTEHDAGHVSRRRPLPGVVAGTVLRAARLSAGISAADLARMSGSGEETIRAWEQGSPPLASVPLPQVERLQAMLIQTGADPQIVADFAAAAWCDLVIRAMLNNETRPA